jgi:hypothetical protein
MLCICNDTFTLLIHILHLSSITGYFLRTLKRKNMRENEGAKELGPLFLSNDQDPLCLERHDHGVRSEVVHHPTRKIFRQEYDAKRCQS